MNIRAINGLKQADRWVQSRFVSGGLILLYHRIAEVDDDIMSDPFSLSVSPSNFTKHLAVLREMWNPISLRELVRTLQDGKFPKRPVALTFDDGYKDNLYRVKPLLEHYQIPATIFVIAGYIGHEREFWWDELVRLLTNLDEYPEQLRLMIQGRSYEWELNSGGVKRRFFSDRFIDRHTVNPRLRLLRTLYKLLRPLVDDERQSVLEDLHQWRATRSGSRIFHAALSQKEVRQLADGGLIEIGSHTMTHPVLATLPLELRKQEILQSKIYLEELLGRPVTAFSYPYGSSTDYKSESVNIVRQAGFEYACAMETGIAWHGSDRFQLPRLWVRNWDEETFARKLNRWVGSRNS